MRAMRSARSPGDLASDPAFRLNRSGSFGLKTINPIGRQLSLCCRALCRFHARQGEKPVLKFGCNGPGTRAMGVGFSGFRRSVVRSTARRRLDHEH